MLEPGRRKWDSLIHAEPSVQLKLLGSAPWEAVLSADIFGLFMHITRRGKDFNHWSAASRTNLCERGDRRKCSHIYDHWENMCCCIPQSHARGKSCPETEDARSYLIFHARRHSENCGDGKCTMCFHGTSCEQWGSVIGELVSSDSGLLWGLRRTATAHIHTPASGESQHTKPTHSTSLTNESER